MVGAGKDWYGGNLITSQRNFQNHIMDWIEFPKWANVFTHLDVPPMESRMRNVVER